jgi:hypothetical protein
MKISRALISGALALVLTSAQGAAFGAPAQAVAQHEERFGRPYPFTGAQIWAMLTKVINLPDSEVTPARIASIFGTAPNTNPTPTRSTSDNIRSYVVRAGRDWYFDVFLSIFPDTGAFQFSFDWGSVGDILLGEQNRLPKDLCITRETVETTMRASGWQALSSAGGGLPGETTSATFLGPARVPVLFVTPPPPSPAPPVIPNPSPVESLKFTLSPSRSAAAYFPRRGQCVVLLSVMRRGRR